MFFFWIRIFSGNFQFLNFQFYGTLQCYRILHNNLEVMSGEAWSTQILSRFFSPTGSFEEEGM